MARANTLGRVALLASALWLLGASAQRAGDIEISHAWARPSVPGATEGVVYLTIANLGQASDALTGAKTQAAKHAELHTNDMSGGMMKMRAIPSLPIPAGRTLSLAPGGDHIMLLDLTAPLKRGDTIAMTLTFQREGDVALSVPVTDAAP